MRRAITILLLAAAPASAHTWSLRSGVLASTQHTPVTADGAFVLAAAPGGATPPHLQSISHLAVLYFAAYLAIVVARCTLLCLEKCAGRAREPEDKPGPKRKTLDGRLEAASDVLFYVPALCILFLAARVWSLHGGDGGVLAPWMAHAMAVVSWATLAEYLLKVVEPEDGRSWSHMICAFLGTLAGACMHAGAAVIVISILTSPFRPSVAMQCLTLLTAVYFAVHALLAVHRGMADWLRQEETPSVDTLRGHVHVGPVVLDRTSRAYAQVQHLKETLALFPMLCIILVSVRMRALELGVDPSRSTETGMIMLAFGGAFQVLTVACEMLLTSLEDYCGKALSMVLSTCETICLVTVYGGVMLVFGELLDWDPSGKVSLLDAAVDARGPIPTSMKCTVTLSVLYFLAYLSVLMARCFQYVTSVFINREEYTKGRVEEVMDHTCKAVVFAPMLSMLMITLRLRSQNLGLADPPTFAQTAMVVSVAALLAQVLIAPVSSFLTGSVFGEENAQAPDSAKYCAVGFMVAHYLTVAVFYAALATLLTALFMAF